MPDCQHVWEEDYLPILEEFPCCDEHPGLVCTVPGCFEYVDLIWEDDPRNVP